MDGGEVIGIPAQQVFQKIRGLLQ
jgi:hypothetical protein